VATATEITKSLENYPIANFALLVALAAILLAGFALYILHKSNKPKR
jgi:hypothetical protein